MLATVNMFHRHKFNVSVNNITLYFIRNKNSILSVRHVPLGPHNALKYKELLDPFSQRA